MKKSTRITSIKDCLIGRYFHSLENGKVCWQGVVIGRISDAFYLVQIFEWAMGQPFVQRIVAVSEMSQWLFYSDADEMKESCEHGAASRLKADRT